MSWFKRKPSWWENTEAGPLPQLQNAQQIAADLQRRGWSVSTFDYEGVDPLTQKSTGSKWSARYSFTAYINRDGYGLRGPKTEFGYRSDSLLTAAQYVYRQCLVYEQFMKTREIIRDVAEPDVPDETNV